jgi:hypothetical protein
MKPVKGEEQLLLKMIRLGRAKVVKDMIALKCETQLDP